VPDRDGGVTDYTIALNWIRSGTNDDQDDATNNDYNPPPQGSTANTWLDPREDYEKVLGGIWAPYRLGSRFSHGMVDGMTINSASLANINSVEVVFTPDKSKWSRCVVLESGEDAILTEDNRTKLQLRAGLSIDKDGNRATPGSGSSNNPNDPNFIAETGMGWFPGYAIDLETGVRLNIMYAEDSWLVGENGRDMMFNPTSNYVTPLGEVLFGGKHFLYIMKQSNKNGGLPAYDHGKYLYDIFEANGSFSPTPPNKIRVFQDAMWVSIPMAANENQWLANEISYRINVHKPYQRYLGAVNTSSGINNDWPAYTFTTKDIATSINNNEVAKSALDIIRAVPNPFNGFSEYSSNQLEDIVKIVNVPEICTIKIFNNSGSLVRTINKDNSLTYAEWNLKNHADIPIASGTYYIHIDAPGIGEKVIKWFGVLRPTDLNAF
jgi:hypothetical protein